MTGLPWCGLTPRAWQPAALAAVRAAWAAGNPNPLVHAATGSGKSILLAEVAAAGRGRCLITTPSQALVAQLAETVATRLPGEVGRAYQHAWEPGKRVVVACNASLDHLLLEVPEWGCWIADEAHRIEGDELRLSADRIVRRVSMGLTATPFRGDRRGLERWSEVVYSYASGQAVRDGVLVPWRAVRWGGDGDGDTDALCVEWARGAEGPGIVSALTIADAEAFAARLVAEGVAAEPIHQRLSTGERELRIRRLKSGRTHCLVHVQLLCEGIDLPWLQWICLRRPVASPVRLVQEVGRVLRAAPGKTEAVIFDPHDLLGELGLVHAAALEDAQKRETAEQAAEVWSIPELEGLGDVSRLPPAKAVQAIEGWVIDLLGELRSHGIAQPPTYGEGRWRRRTATAKQRAALERMEWAARYLPHPDHRRAVRWVLAQERILSGTASDLLDVLRALADAGREARGGNGPLVLPCSVPGIRVPEVTA